MSHPAPESREREDADISCDRCQQYGKVCEWSEKYLACTSCRQDHRSCSEKLARRARQWAGRTEKAYVGKSSDHYPPGPISSTQDPLNRLQLLSDNLAEVEGLGTEDQVNIARRLDDLLEGIGRLREEIRAHDLVQEERLTLLQSLGIMDTHK
jgi:hypothetical protein